MKRDDSIEAAIRRSRVEPRKDAVKKDDGIAALLRQAKSEASGKGPAPGEPGFENVRVKKAPGRHGNALGKALHEVQTAEAAVEKASTFWTATKGHWRKFKAFWPVKAVTATHGAVWKLTDAKTKKHTLTRGMSRTGRGLYAAFTLASAFNVAGFCVPNTATFGPPIDTAAEMLNAVTFEPAMDTAKIVLSGGIQTEKVCLNKYTEIDHKEGIYSINGNEAGKPQDGDHSLYYLMKSSLVHTFWGFSQGHVRPFDPNLAVGPIVNGDSHLYEVQSYGWRSRIAKAAQSYPILLSVERLTDDANLCFAGTKAPDAQTITAQTQTPIQLKGLTP